MMGHFHLSSTSTDNQKQQLLYPLIHNNTCLCLILSCIHGSTIKYNACFNPLCSVPSVGFWLRLWLSRWLHGLSTGPPGVPGTSKVLSSSALSCCLCQDKYSTFVPFCIEGLRYTATMWSVMTIHIWLSTSITWRQMHILSYFINAIPIRLWVLTVSVLKKE